MPENQPSETELDRLQRELLVFLTHRLAEMGVEGQAPAVSLNQAVVDAIARQNDQAARAAAAEVDRQLGSGLAAIAARFDRLESRLAQGGQEAAPARAAPFESGRPATVRSPMHGQSLHLPPALPDEGPDNTGQAEALPLPDSDEPGRGKRSIGMLPIAAIVISALAIAALVLALVTTMGQRDTARAAQRALANNQSAFCAMAGEAIRALPPADAAPNGGDGGTGETPPAGPPEQERLARAAAELCQGSE